MQCNWLNKDSKRSQSSFCGSIDEIPDIAADNFTVSNKKAYFLSHFHSDHIEGLFSTKFLNELRSNEGRVRVYMSETTGTIVSYECEKKNSLKEGLLPYVTTLKIETTTLILPSRDDDDDDDDYLQVTLIPAGHCMGSVMFLYRYRSKIVLFTGDFRINVNNLPYYGQLHEKNEPIKIDAMYLDTTFQDKAHFPSRKEVAERIIEVIGAWVKDDGRKVALYANTRYAYEFLFNEIYKQTGVRVYVCDEKWQLYRLLPDKVQVTNNPLESKIHLCPSKTSNHDKCVPGSTPGQYLYIYLSALTWSMDEEDDAFLEKNENSYKFCFSTHCSSYELDYFVNYLKPKAVKGFREPYRG